MSKGKLPVVIDTNVLIGAMCAELCPENLTYDYMQDNKAVDYALAHCRLVFTQATMRESRDVGVDVRGLTKDLSPTEMWQRIAYVGRFQDRLRPSKPGRTSLAWQCRDRNDVMFLEAASGARARYIVSRDTHILELRQEGRCDFLTPYDFLQRVTNGPPASAPSGRAPQPWREATERSRRAGFAYEQT